MHTRTLFNAALFALVGAVGTAQAEELVLVATGGAFGEVLTEQFLDPFTKETGIDVIFVKAGTQEQGAALRTQNLAGRVEYDLITTTAESLISDAEYLAEIDCAAIPNFVANGVEGSCEGKKFVRTLGAIVLAYNEEAFPNGGPASWADFFDTEKFPGKRCLPGGALDNYAPFLMALLADGVAPADLYPYDFDRALAKLRQIKPDVSVYMTSYSMSQQVMRDRECVMAPMLNGRALSLRAEGAPVAITWGQALVSSANWSIVKGAPNEAAAYRFLDFWMTRPEAHLAFYRAFYYGTTNKDVLSLMSEDDLSQYYASPQNMTSQVPVEPVWIGEHRDDIARTYAKFLAE